jgi:hypothetical protein
VEGLRRRKINLPPGGTVAPAFFGLFVSESPFLYPPHFLQGTSPGQTKKNDERRTREGRKEGRKKEKKEPRTQKATACKSIGDAKLGPDGPIKIVAKKAIQRNPRKQTPPFLFVLTNVFPNLFARALAPIMAPAGVAHHHGMPQHAPMPMQLQPQQPHHHQLAPQPHPHQQPLQPHHPHHPQQHANANAHPMPMAPGAHHHGGAPIPMAQPHHLPPHQSHQQHQQAAATAAAQQAQNNAIEAAKRRSRKPTDKTIPDGVESVVVGDSVQRYRDLRDFERRLDATMTRKRLDIVDSVQRNGPKVGA